MPTKDHGMLLYLNRILQSGLIKFQCKMDLQKSKAGLYLITEGLFKNGCICEEDYKQLLKQYSDPLTEHEEPQPLTREQIQQRQKTEEKGRLFRMVLEQWDLDHQPGWKERWLQEAEKYPQLPEAQAISLKYLKGRAN